MRAWILISVLSVCAACRPGSEQAATPDAAAEETLGTPVRIAESFVPSRWGEAETVELSLDCRTRVRPDDEDGTCIKISYHPADEFWGAVYWETKKESGVRKPVRLAAGSRISFWARGETGNERVAFELPGNPSSELLARREATRLDSDWKHFELEIGDRAGTPVTGIFGVRWDCATGQNPGGLTFYLDDLRID
ncbi:MAG: hypothetical protein WAO20_04085 [Acidobacteriota bacterium]